MKDAGHYELAKDCEKWLALAQLVATTSTTLTAPIPSTSGTGATTGEEMKTLLQQLQQFATHTDHFQQYAREKLDALTSPAAPQMAIPRLEAMLMSLGQEVLAMKQRTGAPSPCPGSQP